MSFFTADSTGITVDSDAHTVDATVYAGSVGTLTASAPGAPTLFITEGFATGAVLEECVVMQPCTDVEQLDHTDTLTVRIAWPTEQSIVPRTPVRLVGADGVEREFSVNLITIDEGETWADLECISPWSDLTDAGTIRQLVNGELTFSFGGQLTIAEWLTTYFVPDLAADGLAWIDPTLGAIDTNSLVRMDFSRWNRMELLLGLTEATGFEFSLVQSAPGALYQITCDDARGSTLPTVVVSRAVNALAQHRAHEATDVVTYVHPAGDVPENSTEPASIGENAWLATIVAAGWVSLTDLRHGDNAIQFTDAFQHAFLEIPNGLTEEYHEILASRVSDGAVQIADTSLLTSGLVVVRIVADNTGTPLHEVQNPAAAALYRRVVKSLPISGGRGERNWFPNPLAEQSPQVWTGGTGAWVEAHDTSDIVDVNGLTNGSVSVGATSMVVDGFPPNTVLRRGTFFQPPSNESLFVAATVTLNSSGAGTVTLLAALATAIADNAVLRVYRNQYGWPAESGTNILRMQGSSPANAFTSNNFVVPLRGATPRTMWCYVTATFWAPVETTGIGTSPVSVTLDVVDTLTSTTLGTISSAIDVPIQSDARPAPVTFTLKVQINHTATRAMRFVLTSPATAEAAPFMGLYLSGAAVFVSPDENVPLVAGSHANGLLQSGNRYLLANNLVVPAITLSFLELDSPHCTPETVALGQSMYFADYDVTQRVVRIARDHWNTKRTQLTIARLATPAEKLLARFPTSSSGTGLVFGGSGGAAPIAAGSRPSLVFDVRDYGALATYASRAFPGHDNAGAMQTCIDACGLAGGGEVVLPRGKYATTAGWLCEWPNVRIVFEKGAEVYPLFPSAGDNVLFEFNLSPTVAGTTLVGCGLIDPYVRGTDPDLADTTHDHQWTVVRLVCVSSFTLRNPNFNYVNTGTATYGSEGPSVGVHMQGKELIRIEQLGDSMGADLPYFVDENPKEDIDADTLHISDLYVTMPLFTAVGAPGDQPALLFAPGLNIPSFKLSGNGVVAGGSGGILLDDTGAGTVYDVASFAIEQFRTEQQLNPLGWTIYLKKTTGGFYGLRISDPNCNFASGGIYLAGVFYLPRILGGMFARQMPQASSPHQVLGLDFSAAVIVDGKIDGFFIPMLTGGTTLYDFGTHTVRNLSLETPAINRNQLFSIMTVTA